MPITSSDIWNIIKKADEVVGYGYVDIYGNPHHSPISLELYELDEGGFIDFEISKIPFTIQCYSILPDIEIYIPVYFYDVPCDQFLLRYDEQPQSEDLIKRFNLFFLKNLGVLKIQSLQADIKHFSVDINDFNFLVF